MPCPFAGPKMFWAGPNFLSQTKNSITYCGSHKHFVLWNLDLRKPDLRKNLDLRKIVGTTDFLVHKLFDLRKIF